MGHKSMSDHFKQVFESVAPRLIAAAWDFADRSDRIDTIWVYFTAEDTVSLGQVFYQAGGQVLEPGRLDAALPEIDTSLEAQDVLLDELDPLFGELAAVRDSEVPSRTVMRFRPSDQDFTAEFSYEPLGGDAPDGDRVSMADIAERWLERLRTTGNDSADL